MFTKWKTFISDTGDNQKLGFNIGIKTRHLEKKITKR